jgi:hypothetical protein
MGGGVAQLEEGELENGSAVFRSSSQQRKECSDRTHIDEREHESGLF